MFQGVGRLWVVEINGLEIKAGADLQNANLFAANLSSSDKPTGIVIGTLSDGLVNCPKAKATVHPSCFSLIEIKSPTLSPVICIFDSLDHNSVMAYLIIICSFKIKFHSLVRNCCLRIFKIN